MMNTNELILVSTKTGDFVRPDTNYGQFFVVLIFVFVSLMVNRRVMIRSRLARVGVIERGHAHEINVPVRRVSQTYNFLNYFKARKMSILTTI